MRVPILVLAVLLPGVLTAQTRSVSGVVRSRTDTAAIPAAIVSVVGTDLFTTTSDRGEFRLRGLRGDSIDLRIERAGIRSMTVRVTTRAARLEVYVDEEAVELAALSVTGTRDAQRTSSPQQTIAIEPDQLDSFNDLTLGEVLRRAPGLTVSGAPGEASELRMRGLGPEYTQILVDGRRLPGGRDRRDFQVDQLPTWLVERVVILRNATALMPSQSVAGTVNITLRRIPAFTQSDWGVGTGTSEIKTDAMGTNAALHYGKASRRFGYQLSGAIQSRRNEHSGERMSVNSGNKVTQTIADANENTSQDIGAAPHFSWRLKSSALTFSPLYLSSTRDRATERDITITDASFAEAERERSRRQVWRMQLAWTRAPGSTAIGLVAGAQGSGDEQDRTRSRYFSDGSTREEETELDARHDREWYGSARMQMRPGRAHELVVGSDVTVRARSKRRTRSETTSTGTFDRSTAADRYDLTEADAAAFIEERFDAGRFTTLTGGARLEGVRNRARSNEGVEARQDGLLVIPSLHLLHRAGKTNLRASATRTTRRPHFDNLVPYAQRSDGTLTRPDLIGNPQLTAEVASGIDLSLEHFFSRRSTFGVNALGKRVTDRIEKSLNADSSSGRYAERPINVGDGYLIGLELDGQTAIQGRIATFEVWGNVSFYRSKLIDPFTGEERMFSRQPEYVLNAGINQNFRRLGLGAGASINRTPAARRIETSSGLRQSDLEDEGDVVNAYIAKRIGQGIVLRLSGHNLMQSERVRTRTSIAADGRATATTQARTVMPRSFYLTLRTTGRRG